MDETAVSAGVTVTFKQLTQDDVAKGFAALKKGLALMKSLALLTPTTIDNTAIAYLEAFVNAIEPYVEEPWFVAAISLVFGLFGSKEAKAILDHFKLNA
jgi:hypothetical protein